MEVDQQNQPFICSVSNIQIPKPISFSSCSLSSVHIESNDQEILDEISELGNANQVLRLFVCFRTCIQTNPQKSPHNDQSTIGMPGMSSPPPTLFLTNLLRNRFWCYSFW